jgi:hypothetical protein
MKSCLFVTLLALGAGLLAAQEPPLPSPTGTPSPSSSMRPELNIPDIPVPVEPSPLVPSTSAEPNISTGPKKPVPSIPELDSAFQQSSLGQVVEQQRLQLEWRKLKNRAGQESEVIAAKKAIATGRTDPEKRELTRAYYKLFYARMQAMADKPEVKAYLEQRKKDSIDSLAQPHVRPEPSPRPASKR